MPTVTYLAYLRKNKGLTRKKLSVLISRSESTIRSYEKSHRKIPQDIALKLSEIFEIQPSDIVGYSKKIHLTSYEYSTKFCKKKITFSKKPTRIFDLINLTKRSISLKDCHALILRKPI